MSLPPLPRIDYQLPRASFSPSKRIATSVQPRGGADTQLSRKKKAIRTPSGRSMSATEYLRGGYFPSQHSLPEEQQDGKSYA